MQIAQPALALLHVRLDHIARSADLVLPAFALGELGLNELGSRAGDHLGAEPPLELGEERFVAEDQPAVQDRGPDRHVGAREGHALIDRAGGMADLEAEIPQHIKDVLDDALAPCRLLVGQQEKQIDVGMRGKKAAAIAAGGDDGQALACRRVARLVDMTGGEAVEHADQLVRKPREPFRRPSSMPVGVESCPRFRPRRRHHSLQPLDDLDAHGLGVGVCLADALQVGEEITGIEERGGRRCALVHAGGLALAADISRDRRNGLLAEQRLQRIKFLERLPWGQRVAISLREGFSQRIGRRRIGNPGNGGGAKQRQVL